MIGSIATRTACTPKSVSGPSRLGTSEGPGLPVVRGVFDGGAAGFSIIPGAPFRWALVAYLMLQVAYTLGIKTLVILDVMAIALGFIIRVYAGALAIGVVVSTLFFVPCCSRSSWASPSVEPSSRAWSPRPPPIGPTWQITPSACSTR